MSSTVEGGYRPGQRKLKWIVAGILVLGGLLLARLPYAVDPMHRAYFYEPWRASSNAYQAAYATWSMRPFDGYHLTLQYQITRLETQPGQIPDYVTDTCEVDVIVTDRAEQQIETVSNSCDSSVPRSIAQIFAMFEERAARPVGKAPSLDQTTDCYNSDTGYLDLIEAEYDRESGYPHQIGNSPTAWNLAGHCWAWLTYPNDAALVQRDRFIVKNLAPLESTR